MELTKTDIGNYFKWTNNVRDSEINPFISEAKLDKLKPIMPLNFYEAFLAEECTSPQGELCDFYENFIKPLWAAYAYYSFLLWQGANVSQYGIVQNNEPSSEQIDPLWRAALQNDVKSKINVYQAKFYKELKDKNYTFDGEVYNFDCEPRPKLKITAI